VKPTDPVYSKKTRN